MTVTVEDCGAKGDGVTDDTKAFQAAARIAALEKKVTQREEMLRQQWGVYIDVFVTQPPGDMTKHKAFLAFDRRLRKEGILPAVGYEQVFKP